MSGDIYQIETRRRSRSKTPFLRSSCDHENCEHAGEEGHVHHKKKKQSLVPNVQTIVEEHVVETQTSSSSRSTNSKATASRSKGFTQLASSDFIADAKRDSLGKGVGGDTSSNNSTTTTTKSTVTTMFTNTSKRLGNALHSLTAATSTPRSQLETTQNVLNSAQEQRSSKKANGEANLSQDHIAYIEYRDAGEYWNKTPKTDYTYSELSPHRRQLAPGIVAMPNMSRRSLAIHDERVDYMVQQNPAQEEFIRRRYQSKTTHLNYDSSDEVDITHFGQQQQQSWWLVRFISLIVSSVSSTWGRLTSISETETNAYHNYYAKRERQQQHGLIVSSFLSLYRYIYMSIATVLSVDTWLLKSGSTENKSKKRFLILLLILLPLLLLTAWSQLSPQQRSEYVQRTEALLPLPLTVLATLRARLGQASDAFKLLLLQRQPPEAEDEAEAAAIKLQMEQVQQHMQKSLTPEEYENILNHVNSYVQQLVALKLQQQQQQQEQQAPQQQQLSPKQTQIIVQLMRENLQQFVAEQKTQFTSEQLANLALQLKLQLQESGEWQLQQQQQLTLSEAQLEQITHLIKTELKLEETHYTLLLERIDLKALLRRLLGSPELAQFVDARIALQLPQQPKVEGSGQAVDVQQVEQLNREIAFIKLALTDKLAENADLQQSISSLKLSQDDLLARMQQHELAQDQSFTGLLAEIESKLLALNDTQFALLNKQVKLTLVEILGFKQTKDGKLNDLDLQNWVSSMFVAKDYLEQQLLKLHKSTDTHVREEIERSSIVLMADINERLKREILHAVELKQNASSQVQKQQLQEAEVLKIVKSVLATYDADKTGLVDFALESAGGQILSTRCTESFQTKSAQISIFGIPLWYPSNTPRVAISPDVHPGECWAFQGFPGFLVLKLNSMIYVTGFTLEHISKSLSPTGRIDSAPRNFTVWGLDHEKDQEPVLFGEYEFQNSDASLQYFAVQNGDIQRPYEIVELRIETNHGQPDYTCLYRFRVHGKPPAS